MTSTGQLRDDLPFDEWVDYVFDHEDPHWHFVNHSIYWNEERNMSVALSHMGQLFDKPGFLLERFSPNQIGAGVNFIISPSCSSHSFALLDGSLPLEERLSCLKAIHTLYDRVFSNICLRETSDDVIRANPSRKQAHYACFIFWDEIPLHPRTKNPYSKREDDVRNRISEHLEIERACLETMAKILEIDHVACKEAAIHGLGHWAYGYPKEISHLLERATRQGLIPAELESYARAARTGHIP